MVVSRYVWGYMYGTSHKQHLFPVENNSVCMQSLCGRAYSGDRGIGTSDKRKRCKYCVNLEQR
jgi:hypothetical protein